MMAQVIHSLVAIACLTVRQAIAPLDGEMLTPTKQGYLSNG
jgi:hypothetical protein